MSRLTITLSEQRYRALKEASAQRNKTIGQLVDESLDFFGIKSQQEAMELVQRAPLSAVVEARKLPKICERLACCGAIVQVTCVLAGSDEQRREDRDATDAAVQNLCLAAQVAGLGSFWSTSPLLTHPEVLRWFGSDPAQEAHVATVWLGVSAELPTPPRRRPVAEVLRWA